MALLQNLVQAVCPVLCVSLMNISLGIWVQQSGDSSSQLKFDFRVNPCIRNDVWIMHLRHWNDDRWTSRCTNKMIFNVRVELIIHLEGNYLLMFGCGQCLLRVPIAIPGSHNNGDSRYISRVICWPFAQRPTVASILKAKVSMSIESIARLWHSCCIRYDGVNKKKKRLSMTGLTFRELLK